jgi:hypothetical protein
VVDENCAILCYHVTSSGNFLPNFQNILVPETSVINYHYPLRDNLEEHSYLLKCEFRIISSFGKCYVLSRE